MNVSSIIVTRGDQDLTPIFDALPQEWEVVIWDNGKKKVRWLDRDGHPGFSPDVPDLSVYGRYAAIEYASGDLIYVQDDDCVVSDPQALVAAWYEADDHPDNVWPGETFVVCNMPPEFRHAFYEDHALVGFGAVFHRDAPERAWWRFRGGFDETEPWVDFNMDWFHRTCDVVFTALTPRVLVDVPYENLPWAHHETRMWRQPGHLAERVRMLDLVKQIA